MTKVITLSILLCLFLSPIVLNQAIAQEKKTGLPLPRFVSLRSDTVNIRTGPGLRYPIAWVYKKRTMPVEIIAEFETWRKVRDWENTVGWVHQSMLTGKRTMIIVNSTQTIRKHGAAYGSAIAEAEPGVVGQLIQCDKQDDWCRVKISKYEGWLRRTQMWGVYPRELVK